MTQDLNDRIEHKRNGTIPIVKMSLTKIRHIKLTKITKKSTKKQTHENNQNRINWNEMNNWPPTEKKKNSSNNNNNMELVAKFTKIRIKCQLF